MSIFRPLRPLVSFGTAMIFVLGANSGAFALTVTGAGSTFVQPIIAKWAEDYAKAGHDTISYQSVGSSAGITAIEAGQVDFGASDKPLDSKELNKYGLIQFPIIVGAVVPVFNLPGIGNGGLRFSGKLLADIYAKKITRWDDSQIQEQNTRVKLPAMPITVVHRSDGSGTTFNFTDFLAKSSPDWRQHVGIGLTVSWPTGLAGQGNAGVSENVRRLPGALGYVEYAYAIQNKLTYGQVENVYRFAVSPTAEAIQAAAETVDWRHSENFTVLMTNMGGPTSYPIAATTFILMPKAPKDKAQSNAALSFFHWALENGDTQAAALHFVALPPNLVAMIEAYWAKQLLPARTSQR